MAPKHPPSCREGEQVFGPRRTAGPEVESSEAGMIEIDLTALLAHGGSTAGPL